MNKTTLFGILAALTLVGLFVIAFFAPDLVTNEDGKLEPSTFAKWLSAIGLVFGLGGVTAATKGDPPPAGPGESRGYLRLWMIVPVALVALATTAALADCNAAQLKHLETAGYSVLVRGTGPGLSTVVCLVSCATDADAPDGCVGQCLVKGLGEAGLELVDEAKDLIPDLVAAHRARTIDFAKPAPASLLSVAPKLIDEFYELVGQDNSPEEAQQKLVEKYGPDFLKLTEQEVLTESDFSQRQDRRVPLEGATVRKLTDHIVVTKRKL